MLFAHAQSFTPATVTLAQAGLLIAAYEYAKGLTDAAYVSIGTCARMAYVVGMNPDALPVAGPATSKTASGHWDAEQLNLFWGMLLCEKYVSITSLSLNYNNTNLYVSGSGSSPARAYG